VSFRGGVGVFLGFLCLAAPANVRDLLDSYHPSEKAEVLKARKAFGPLVLKAGDNSEKALPRPWSGYWYPFRTGEMFTGIQSPLAKVDTMLRNLGYTSHVQKADQELYASFPSDTWEGLCDAWAFAAVGVKEPTKAVQRGGVIFSVMDLKALATRLHQGTTNDQFGTLYRGTVETDGTYQDLRPEAFHQILVKSFAQGRHLLIDDEAGIEVWSKPAFRYDTVVTKDPEMENALLVRTRLHIVSERRKESDQPTTLDDTAVKVYDYRLYYGNSGHTIVAGEWIDDSYRNHPDAVFVPKFDGKIATKNAELNKFSTEVLKLLQLGAE